MVDTYNSDDALAARKVFLTKYGSKEDAVVKLIPVGYGIVGECYYELVEAELLNKIFYFFSFLNKQTLKSVIPYKFSSYNKTFTSLNEAHKYLRSLMLVN